MDISCNIELYTFVALFSGKFDPVPPLTALRNAWMAPYTVKSRSGPSVQPNPRYSADYTSPIMWVRPNCNFVLLQHKTSNPEFCDS